MAQFVGYDLVKSKKDNKKYINCFFLEERQETDFVKGYRTFSEFIPYDSSIVALVGLEVNLIYSKNYKGFAILSSIVGVNNEPLGKDN